VGSAPNRRTVRCGRCSWRVCQLRADPPDHTWHLVPDPGWKIDQEGVWRPTPDREAKGQGRPNRPYRHQDGPTIRVTVTDDADIARAFAELDRYPADAKLFFTGVAGSAGYDPIRARALPAEI